MMRGGSVEGVLTSMPHGKQGTCSPLFSESE